MTTQNVAPKPATANTERSVERVKELRAQIDRDPLAFAIQAERLEREHTKLVEDRRRLVEVLRDSMIHYALGYIAEFSGEGGDHTAAQGKKAAYAARRINALLRSLVESS